MTEPSGDPAIAVVGSMNLDLVVTVPSLPGPGETVVGDDLFRNPGGKGANQAVAAGRLGRSVAMVGCVGRDDAGRILVDALHAAGVDASNVRVTGEAPTGTALIAVAAGGENQIVVSPGANRLVGPADVERASGVIGSASVTLLQLEVPLGAVLAAAEASGGRVVLNPAPARDLPPDVLAMVDVLVPNRVELAQLTASPVPGSAEEAAELAGRLPARACVVTLGSEGALVVEDGRTTYVPPVPVDAVDTTAAGDAFCGALADELARGGSLVEAARWAARVAAAACTKVGAQSSLPTRAEASAL